MVVLLFIGLVLAGLKIAQLSARIQRMEADAASQLPALTTMIRELRDQRGRPENPFEIPDGYVAKVDRERQAVVINITSAQGAMPGLRLTIFDATASSVATEKPKGLIEVTQVGQQSSIASIIHTADAGRPVRVGDIVYSPAWSPNLPMRFALVGMMDANRDGKDDRDELKRMIRAAGGIIDFDFPPADVGQVTGSLSPRIDWYVVDDRTSPSAPQATRVTEVIKEARLDGIRPLPMGRLLTYLGHDMRQPSAGRARTAGGARSGDGDRGPK
jgi:hypothetical protein